jgi:Rad3-related DNA helicase
LTGKVEPDKALDEFLAKNNLQLSTSTIVLMEKLLFFYKFHSRAENRSFYKGNIEIAPSKQQQAYHTQSSVESPKGMFPGFTVTLSFWSMLPAIAFSDAFSTCRSIILASGTLCPLDTFCGELGVNFDYKMEGEQIIPAERIFCTALRSVSSGIFA